MVVIEGNEIFTEAEHISISPVGVRDEAVEDDDLDKSF
ncbi:hypothetical protein GGE07_006075 [Sinorhizobium terangae]|nr:hypothetical protein [Sinorhizobium terangae]